jgi:hypothetical protein
MLPQTTNALERFITLRRRWNQTPREVGKRQHRFTQNEEIVPGNRFLFPITTKPEKLNACPHFLQLADFGDGLRRERDAVVRK